MKPVILTLLILSTTAFAAGEKPLKKNEIKSGIVINDSLQKLMDIKGVAPLYEKCKTETTTTGDDRSQKIISCLWDKVSKDEALKKKVQMAYVEETKAKASLDGGGRSPASSKSTLTARNASVVTDYETDPAVKALSEFYAKKLEAIMDPDKALTKEESKSGLILSTNHKQFIDLYKSELGKTIINAFTSYCLETEPIKLVMCNDEEKKIAKENKTSRCDEPDFEISDDADKRIKAREANLKALATLDLKTKSADSYKWTQCITSVPNSCKKDKYSETTAQSETVRRSCLIMDYVESARKNIIAADAQQEFYKELNSSATVQIGGMAKVLDKPEQVSTDAILNMTSDDVTKALEKPMTAEVAEFEKCFKEGKIVNEKACEKYMNTNAKENEMAIAELGIRQMAQETELKEKLDSSSEKVISYLKEEGYSDAEAKALTDEPAKIEKVKEEILLRYKNQKLAIIAEMAARINNKTSAVDGKIDGTADISKLTKIKDELSSRTADFSGLVKFNNIVSSYLTVAKAGSADTRNTAGLYAEVKTMNEADRKIAQEQIQKADLKENVNPAGESSTNLNVETINSAFLKYSTQPEKEEKSK